MKAYLVDLVDPKTKVRQRIWVKAHARVSAQEIAECVARLDGLKVDNPEVVSYVEKTLPYSINQKLVEKIFPVFTISPS